MKALPRTVWRLMVVNALMMYGISLMVLIAGIIGVDFAPLEGLATLPIACLIVGVAIALSGHSEWHYWLSLVLLGVGWVPAGSCITGDGRVCCWPCCR